MIRILYKINQLSQMHNISVTLQLVSAQKDASELEPSYQPESVTPGVDVLS